MRDALFTLKNWDEAEGRAALIANLLITAEDQISQIGISDIETYRAIRRSMDLLRVASGLSARLANEIRRLSGPVKA